MAYANGDNYRRIGERLCIAPSTVRTHLATIYRKMGVSSKLELHKVLEGGQPTYVAEGEQAALISEMALSLEEAISRERALGEVLKIISGSNGELDKVIAAVLGYALELCDAEFGILFEWLNSRFVGIVVEFLSIRFGSQRDGSRALSGLVLACR